ncbi:MAG: hypothetical protein ACO1TE_17545 [Prosthecobacter sp.]
MTNLLESIGDNPWTVVSSNLFALIFAVAIITIAYRLGRKDGSYLINWMLCVLGALIGWAIGILAAPFNESESQRFLALGQAVSVFLSGYVISKLDRFLEGTLYSDGAPQGSAWMRLCLFVVSLLLAVIIVFINRLYFNVRAM